MIGKHEFNDLNYSNVLNVAPVSANYAAVPTAYFLGRWFEQKINDETFVSTITEGSSIFFEFEGPKVAIDFKIIQTMCIIAVSIDGQEYRKLPATPHCVISKSLNQGRHTIRVVVDAIKETDDVWFGGKGLAVERVIANEVHPVKPTNKVAWFFGDSITAGIHVNGDPEPETNSYIQSYTNVAAEVLQVANIPIAFGATGVTTGGSGNVPKALDYLNFAKQGVPAICDQPSFCVINYGTNDRTKPHAFEESLLTFVQALRAKLPTVPIILLRPFVGDFPLEIQAVAKAVPNTTYVDTANWQFDDYTDGLHPNAYGHKKLGLYLAQKLQGQFGVNYFYD